MPKYASKDCHLSDSKDSLNADAQENDKPAGADKITTELNQRQSDIRESDKRAFTLGVAFIIFTEYLVLCKVSWYWAQWSSDSEESLDHFAKSV